MSGKQKAVETAKKKRTFYSIHPWQYRLHKSKAEVIAYIEASGEWEKVAVVQNTTGDSSERIAAFLCNLVNENQERLRLLCDAMDALQLCLDDEKLTFSSEQAAESVVSRIQKKIL